MMAEALSDPGLLAVLLWLDPSALEAAERVCRRWRRIALCPASCRVHRPRARAWDDLDDRAAVVAERTVHRGWLSGRHTTAVHVADDTAFPLAFLDGPRLVVPHRRHVDVLDARHLATLWRHDVPGAFTLTAADGPRMAVFCQCQPGRRDAVLHAGSGGSQLRATEARLLGQPDCVFWRGDHVAYGGGRDGVPVLARADAESGRVVRSLPLDAKEIDDLEDAFGLADGAGVGIVARSGLWLDDGRSARAALLPMRHNPRHHGDDCRWWTHAHPDGHTLLTVPYSVEHNRYIYNVSPVVMELWDMRALAHPRVSVVLQDGLAQFVSFGRDVVRTATDAYHGVRLAHHDLHTAAPVGEPYTLDGDDVADLHLQCANEAFAVFGWRNPARGASHWTVHSFDGALPG